MSLPSQVKAARPMPVGDPDWYKKAVFYEVLVRAFADSDGDGTGDLRGLIDKLDYLAWLGVDCLWLPPFYDSPLRDGGYDIRDYTKVLPEFGTVQDFVINIGELLEMASSGYLKATTHRVVSPPLGQERLSVAFFLGAKLDALLGKCHWDGTHGDTSDPEPCDSDGDTVSDYVELSGSHDPDVRGNGSDVSCPKYGCGASIGALPRDASESTRAVVLTTAVAGVFVLVRRRRRRT
jgi:hypothetical protein